MEHRASHRNVTPTFQTLVAFFKKRRRQRNVYVSQKGRTKLASKQLETGLEVLGRPKATRLTLGPRRQPLKAAAATNSRVPSAPLTSQPWAGAALASQASALSLFPPAHCSGLDPWRQAADAHVPSEYTGTRRGPSHPCLLQGSRPTQHADPHCCLSLFYFFNSGSSQQPRTP